MGNPLEIPFNIPLKYDFDICQKMMFFDAKFRQMGLLHVRYPLVNVCIDVQNPPFVDQFPKFTLGFPHLHWVITSRVISL
jgi:hypothetical protein